MYRQRKGLRYLIIDVQNAPDQVVDSTQTISGGILSYQVLNINQPVFAGFWLLRWQADLTATYTSAQTNAVYGRNWFNCNGWLQPAGTSLPLQPMFGSYSSRAHTTTLTPYAVGLQMKSGNNNLLYQASIYDFLDDKSIRYFKNGASTVRGIPGFSYAHVPTAPNTCSGMIDFSVVNQPMVFWQFASSPPFATVALWAAQDIGFSSSLVISNIMYTYNNVDVTNYDVIRMLLKIIITTDTLVKAPSTRCTRRRSRPPSHRSLHSHSLLFVHTRHATGSRCSYTPDSMSRGRSSTSARCHRLRRLWEQSARSSFTRPRCSAVPLGLTGAPTKTTSTARSRG
jgi:hypothetical protein